MKTCIIFIVACLLWAIPARSHALTVEEILLLKQNGVSEATIQMMLQSEIQAQSRQGNAPGESMGVRTIERPGGQSAIVYSTGRGDQDARTAEERWKEEQAWEMLRHIIVDTRIADDRGLLPAN
ncbi:MAG: hypothetical protein PVG51_15885 [Desulfosarcina sp.]|jgi:hypothetical protein